MGDGSAEDVKGNGMRVLGNAATEEVGTQKNEYNVDHDESQ